MDEVTIIVVMGIVLMVFCVVDYIINMICRVDSPQNYRSASETYVSELSV